MKFCRDCKHFRPTQYTPCFTQPEVCVGGPNEYDLVSGKPIVRTPSLERARNALGERCGVDGKWFEQKADSE